MGIAGAIVPLVAASISLTVLAAALALLGPRIDALTPRRLVRHEPPDADPAPHALVPAGAVACCTAPAASPRPTGTLLLLLGLPFLGVRFVGVDASVLPAEQHSRPPGRRGAAHGLRPRRLLADPGRVEAPRRRRRRGRRLPRRGSRRSPATDAVLGAPAARRRVADRRLPVRAAARRRRRSSSCATCGPRTRRSPSPSAARRRASSTSRPPAGAHPAGPGDPRRHHPRAAVPDDRLDRAADQGRADERADGLRDLRPAGADLPGRQPDRACSTTAAGRARGDAAHPALRHRVRPLHRLRHVPARPASARPAPRGARTARPSPSAWPARAAS